MRINQVEQLNIVKYSRCLFTQHLVGTLKAQLLDIAITVETDNRCTKEDIKDSLLELVSKELDEYELNYSLKKRKES
ncbi:hypothetical protein D4741_20030 [Pseudoalteromonas gelatinilytica]|uniref:Uncharacterized protein n=1 Tax=Pseudoalteromonas gelatinilytica TaxID=1703256 RepID=A0A3A3EYH8_9GAMM|nr:hypothetical protein D4741_20030 [Pseudoalteromonas profundi]